MSARPALMLAAGAALVAATGYLVGQAGAPALQARLDESSAAALARAGTPTIRARFVNRMGDVTRHPVLTGGEGLPDDRRAAAAYAVAAVPGVGGVSWADGLAGNAGAETPLPQALNCQDDVDGLLRQRSLRFQEGSAALLPASDLLLEEVAAALRPCAGAIIAITGHTDRSGDEAANLRLSANRARSVREALVARGIARADLRARGVGSAETVAGLTPGDPANRRIEFKVVRKVPLEPTPVDTPGAR